LGPIVCFIIWWYDGICRRAKEIKILDENGKVILEIMIVDFWSFMDA
jgi:hypothetical protein